LQKAYLKPMGLSTKGKAVKILASDLEAFCIEVMRCYGIREDDARLTAHIAVTIDTWGIHTHGTRQLRPLLKNFPIGRLDAQASPEVIKEGLAWALIDGHHAMPFVTAHKAMNLGHRKSKNSRHRLRKCPPHQSFRRSGILREYGRQPEHDRHRHVQR
jgi:malate/lactate dehydrogenase-like protein